MAMMSGYSIYLVYSLLFWPMAYLTGRAIVIGDTENTLFRVANGFAALSALARALGLVRWLFAMQVLARLYTNPMVSENFKESITGQTIQISQVLMILGADHAKQLTLQIEIG